MGCLLDLPYLWIGSEDVIAVSFFHLQNLCLQDSGLWNSVHMAHVLGHVPCASAHIASLQSRMLRPPHLCYSRNPSAEWAAAGGKKHSHEDCFSLWSISKLMFPSHCFHICFLTLSKDFFKWELFNKRKTLTTSLCKANVTTPVSTRGQDPSPRNLETSKWNLHKIVLVLLFTILSVTDMSRPWNLKEQLCYCISPRIQGVCLWWKKCY